MLLDTEKGPVEGGGAVCDLCLYGIWYLGGSLSFVLTVSSLCFRYFGFQMEELGMTAEHTPHVSVFYELL